MMASEKKKVKAGEEAGEKREIENL